MRLEDYYFRLRGNVSKFYHAKSEFWKNLSGDQNVYLDELFEINRSMMEYRNISAKIFEQIKKIADTY